jgi:hypothetical protein
VLDEPVVHRVRAVLRRHDEEAERLGGLAERLSMRRVRQVVWY